MLEYKYILALALETSMVWLPVAFLLVARLSDQLRYSRVISHESPQWFSSFNAQ